MTATTGSALVTGATGFLGGRLVERLVLERRTPVRALLRSYAHAARLARFDVELVRCDLADEAQMQRAVRGCEVVYHCAHDFGAPEHNLLAARALARACLDAGVRRLVYVSSAAVYEPLGDGLVDESAATEPSGWPYKDTKIEIERELVTLSREQGLPVVVLQPTIVYGPFGSYWTQKPIDWLRAGRVVLPADADGLCNAVYVDDVTDGLLAGAEADGVEGERIILSGACPVGWRAYFRAFERALGVESVVLMPTEEIRRHAENGRLANLYLATAREPLTSLGHVAVTGGARLLPSSLRLSVHRRLLAAPHPWAFVFPDEERLALYQARATFSIEKARRLLRFEPQFDFERGMALTSAYVAWTSGGRHAGAA